MHKRKQLLFFTIQRIHFNTMLLLYRHFTNPYQNIAAEEYYVKNTTEDLCMVWRNEPSVIIGKHQNAFAEINYPYIIDQKIPVIRRISGGGAVYHDLGNLNFTFVKKTDKANQVDFSRFTNVIIEFMQSLGIEANANYRNSLFIGDLKFSGHAEHLFHDRVLHHGTLLFNSDLERLNACLNPISKYKGKAMPSVRSNVGNIAPLLSNSIDIQTFITIFMDWLRAYYRGSVSFPIRPDELEAIKNLAESKYKSWDWNFGYSPSYSFNMDIQAVKGIISIIVKIENGKILNIESPSKRLSNSLSNLLSNMKGLYHRQEEIDRFVQNNTEYFELEGINIVNFTDSFFS